MFADEESRAVNGSSAAPFNGDGFGLATIEWPSSLPGLPRRIGVISGMDCFSSVGGAWKAPTIGGVATFGSGDGRCWLLRASDCVRPAYIYSRKHMLDLIGIEHSHL